MRISAHPGKILKREIETRNMSANRLALDLGVPATRISEILRGRCGITPETALRMAAYFGGSPQFWMNMQTNHDIGLTLARTREGSRAHRAPAFCPGLNVVLSRSSSIGRIWHSSVRLSD